MQIVGFCCRPVLAQEWRSLRFGAVFAAVRLADGRTHGAWGLEHGSACAGCRGSRVRSRAVGVVGAGLLRAELLSATLGSGCGRRATRRGRCWREQGLTAYWRAGPVSLKTAFAVGSSPDQVETAAVTDGARDAAIESLAAV